MIRTSLRLLISHDGFRDIEAGSKRKAGSARCTSSIRQSKMQVTASPATAKPGLLGSRQVGQQQPPLRKSPDFEQHSPIIDPPHTTTDQL